MMMIVMEVEMRTGMVMGEKENGVTEMMKDMVGMQIHMAVMVIDMAGTMRTAMAEMVIGMKIIAEGVEVLMVINMGQQEVEALTEIENVALKMMVNIHLGLSTLYFSTSYRHACNTHT